MIYPCTGCLVDVICTDACDNFIWYMDELETVIPLMVVNTAPRYRRAGRSATMYQKSVKLYIYLTRTRDFIIDN